MKAEIRRVRTFSIALKPQIWETNVDLLSVCKWATASGLRLQRAQRNTHGKAEQPSRSAARRAPGAHNRIYATDTAVRCT